MRLIDADELMQMIPTEEYDARMAITFAPTVDAEPIRHGHWVPQITALGTMIFWCSDCQRFSDVNWAYCPRCGSKMDGERKEDAETD